MDNNLADGKMDIERQFNLVAKEYDSNRRNDEFGKYHVGSMV